MDRNMSTITQTSQDREIQFMPFAALKGYYEMINKKERLKQPRTIHSDEENEYISSVLLSLRSGEKVLVRYYEKDAYVNISGMVGQMDHVYRRLTVNNTVIGFDDIYSIDVIE